MFAMGAVRGLRCILRSLALAGLLSLYACNAEMSDSEFSIWARNASQRYEPLALALLQQDSPCSDGPTVTKQRCLTKAPNCMFLDLGVKNLCLPCEFGGVEIPCPSMNAVYNGHKVKQCVMQCAHQRVLTKVSPCTDISGAISTSQCFQKGITGGLPPGIKCMWTGYVTASGQGKSICGPCTVPGIGTIPCNNLLDKGPEAGSTVMGCASMCDNAPNEFGVPCNPLALPLPIPAVPNCWGPPPPPPPPMKGVVPLETLKIKTGPDAPTYYAVTVDAPYGPRQYTEAASMAMRAAGWAPNAPMPPDAAVVMYGPPPPDAPTMPPNLRVQYGPAPVGMLGVPPPGYGYGTVPPEANVQASMDQGGAALMETGSLTSKLAESGEQGVEVSMRDLLNTDLARNDPEIPKAWSSGILGPPAALVMAPPNPPALLSQPSTDMMTQSLGRSARLSPSVRGARLHDHSQ